MKLKQRFMIFCNLGDIYDIFNQQQNRKRRTSRRINNRTILGLRNSFGSKFEKFQAFSAIFCTYSNKLSINSTLSYLYLFLFGSMLKLFTEVIQEAVYNLC